MSYQENGNHTLLFPETNLTRKAITIGGRLINDTNHKSVYNGDTKSSLANVFIGGTVQTLLEPLKYYEVIQAVAQMVTGVLGFMGACWIIYHYGRRKILNNIAGLIIYATAFVDLIHGAYYFEAGVSMATQYRHYHDWSDTARSQFFNISEALFMWSAITSGLLITLLATNTLYIVRFGGTAKTLHRFKYIYTILCFILPFFIFFIPVSIARDQPLFQTRNRSRALGECINFFRCDFQLFLFAGLLTLNIVFSLVAYFLASIAIRTNSTHSDRIDSGVYSDSSSRAKNAVAKLIKLYSISILIGWIPYLIRLWYVRVLPATVIKNNESLGDVLDTIRSFTAPFRGYLHALAVHIVNRSALNVSEPSLGKRIINILFLISPKEEDIKSSTQTIPSIERSLQDPQWEISYQDNTDTQFSQISMSRLSKV